MEAIENLWTGSIMTYSHTVIAVDDVVTIHITVFYITRSDGREGLYGTIVYICLVTKETNGLQTEELVERMTSLDQIVIEAWFLQLFLHLAGIEAKVSTGIKFYLSNTLGVIQTNLHSPCIDNSCILVWFVETYHIGVLTICAHPDVGTMLIVSLQCHIKSIK